MRIVAVNPFSRRDLLRFIKFPLLLYSSSQFYVPHLTYERMNFFNPRKNPFFRHASVEYYLALSGKGEVIGRVTAHIDWNYVDYHTEKKGFFGFFDCVDNPDVARALLDRASDSLREKGMEGVIGPVSFSTNDEVGILVKGFESPPSIMMPYNFRYYGRLLEECGFQKAKDLYAYFTEYDGTTPEAIVRVSERMKRRTKVTLRKLDMKNFQEDLKIVSRIYNSAWEDNWGFTPMSDDEVRYLGQNLKQIVDPEIVFFAYIADRPVGFFIAIPDYNPVLKELNGRLFPFGFLKLLGARKKLDRLRVLVMGVVDEYRRSGIESALLEEIFRVGPENGYYKGELSWILEDNVIMNKIISRIVKDPYKIYRVYERGL
ncbi:MAG: GNAT family N-acetyltransferase [Deltaproteobacteria bacterium]|nr:GNAT family N-acetyltransferase [Deltaproteobacteria bacterium]NIS77452.1 GNAT family N-acetyltransferase [Deltaproteobacteria bacterium]